MSRSDGLIRSYYARCQVCMEKSDDMGDEIQAACRGLVASGWRSKRVNLEGSEHFSQGLMRTRVLWFCPEHAKRAKTW